MQGRRNGDADEHGQRSKHELEAAPERRIDLDLAIDTKEGSILLHSAL
jgi:hypothetical protein